jgi:predicted RNA-binding protein (virulence factor B family)
MKDLFVPKSKQLMGMRPGGEYLVKIYLDEKTGRLAATEKIEPFLSNEDLTLQEKDLVNLTVYRRTDIGYVVIINHRHTGVLHFSEIFGDISTGDTFPGFIKKIVPADQNDSGETLIDVVTGKPGYDRTEDAAGKILRLLKENKGSLPYHDKSDPETIYSVFGMSKKTFKMTTGRLYKEKKIVITDTGIELSK